MFARRFLGVSLIALLLAATPGLTQDRGGFGRRSRNMDPNDFFNRMANGKDVWLRAELTDPYQQAMFDRTAGRMGVTNGQITREQFTAYMQQRMASRAAGGGPPRGPPRPRRPPRSIQSRQPARSRSGSGRLVRLGGRLVPPPRPERRRLPQ